MLLQGEHERRGERTADQISANNLITFVRKEESDFVISTVEKVFSKKCYTSEETVLPFQCRFSEFKLYLLLLQFC